MQMRALLSFVLNNDQSAECCFVLKQYFVLAVLVYFSCKQLYCIFLFQVSLLPGDVPCPPPGGGSCPDDNTCCPIPHGGAACCPYKNVSELSCLYLQNYFCQYMCNCAVVISYCDGRHSHCHTSKLCLLYWGLSCTETESGNETIQH